MHTCMVHTHTLICTLSLCIYVHVHTRTHTHVHACVHSHTQHYSGEVMLQAFTAKAEPMRGWDARSQIRRRGCLPGNIPSSKARGSPSQAGASPAPGSWPCLLVEKDPMGETSGQAAEGHLQSLCKATRRETKKQPQLNSL